MSHPHVWEDLVVVSTMDGNGKFAWSSTSSKCKRCGATAYRGPGGFVGDEQTCDDNIARRVLES